MNKLILTSTSNNKTTIQTEDAAYWAMRARLICPHAKVSYQTKKNFWPLPFSKVGIKNER